MPFNDMTLIVTGASQGIGRALCMALAGLGADLIINARSMAPLEEVRRACLDRGVAVQAVAGSVADPHVARKLVDLAQTGKKLHGFIHAAGVLHPGPYVWELDRQNLNEIFESNVIGAFELIRHAVPLLREQGRGWAVFFGSGAAEIAQPGIAAYCAAKAAEEHLARQLAAEAPEVTTFIYRPGVVETRMQAQARESRGGAARDLSRVFTAWQKQGLLITPEQSAAGLVRILSDNPEACHGKVMDVRDLG